MVFSASAHAINNKIHGGMEVAQDSRYRLATQHLKFAQISNLLESVFCR